MYNESQKREFSAWKDPSSIDQLSIASRTANPSKTKERESLYLICQYWNEPRESVLWSTANLSINFRPRESPLVRMTERKGWEGGGGEERERKEGRGVVPGEKPRLTFSPIIRSTLSKIKKRRERPIKGEIRRYEQSVVFLAAHLRAGECSSHIRSIQPPFTSLAGLNGVGGARDNELVPPL